MTTQAAKKFQGTKIQEWLEPIPNKRYITLPSNATPFSAHFLLVHPAVALYTYAHLSFANTGKISISSAFPHGQTRQPSKPRRTPLARCGF